MLMIDWVTAKVPFYHPGIVSDGRVLNITRDGEIQFSTLKRMMMRGSYDASISIRTMEIDGNGDTSLIELSGNPAKFLQGHNIFGSTNLLGLVAETVSKLAHDLNAPQPPKYTSKVARGHYTVSRVDINQMFELSSRADVNSYLHSLAIGTRTRTQSAISKGSTVYLNKDSKRWTFKFYSKGQETALRRNNKQGCFELSPEMQRWVDPMLRSEVTLKSKELIETHLNYAHVWAKLNLQEIFKCYRERVDMSGQKLDIDVANLAMNIRPKAAAGTYQIWSSGIDPRITVEQRTFYRHRKALLAFGVDISSPPPPAPEKPDNVQSMFEFVHLRDLKPAELPPEFRNSELFFEPRPMKEIFG
jgi:II/X family phage/plasmid replication protein